jgi:hypothetical protein
LTGSLVTAGGLGVSLNADIGGTLTVAGISTLNDVVTATITTDSTTTSLGSLVQGFSADGRREASDHKVVNLTVVDLPGITTASVTLRSTYSVHHVVPHNVWCGRGAVRLDSVLRRRYVKVGC